MVKINLKQKDLKNTTKKSIKGDFFSFFFLNIITSYHNPHISFNFWYNILNLNKNKELT